MVPATHHLKAILKDTTFCDITGLSEGLGESLACANCRSGIVNDV